MALYPYTITAIAKNTNETSNIVPGAMVSLLDSNGNAVVMYDDASGSNGSTGKVADTRGQVTVYVEQGEYSLNVNGTANGKFIVSSSEKQTTLELINSTNTYQAGDTITTTGFTTAGDGGGAQWLATATTGQTPSQTPADRGAAELADGSGRKWELVREGNYIELSKLGAQAGSDITDILNAATSTIGVDGGVVKIPHSTIDNPYIISSIITIRDNVSLVGMGQTSSVISVAAGTNDTIFNARNRVNVSFSDFTLIGNSDSQTAGNGINFENVLGVSVKNVKITDIYKEHIIVKDCEDVIISNINLDGGGYNDARGISISTSKNCVVSDVLAIDVGGSVVNISGSSDIVVCNINGIRDYISLGWTGGKAVLRVTNDSSRVSATSINSNGFSRGIFVTTGSESVSISGFNIINCESSGVWIEGLNQASGKVAISSGSITNTGILATTEVYSVYLTDTTGNRVESVFCDADIVEDNISTITADKNIITGNRVLGAITTVGANTVDSNNITGP